jgi:hypothetical protein
VSTKPGPRILCVDDERNAHEQAEAAAPDYETLKSTDVAYIERAAIASEE